MLQKLMQTLPALSDLRTLADHEVADYQTHGWTILRNVCAPDEIEVFASAIREATIEHNRETRPLAERDTYGKAFLQTMNLWRLDPVVAAFTLAPRFGHIAAQLLGCEGVRLYHDQSLFKEPGGGPTPWHQDAFFWPLRGERTVTMWMPLVDISAEMGSMSFADESHETGIVTSDLGISDQSEAYFQGYIDGAGYRVRTPGPMAAGDATFHNGITFHRAPGNPTDRVRAIMTVIFVADGEVVQAPSNANQSVDLHQWIPGVWPGQPVASELNPLVFPA